MNDRKQIFPLEIPSPPLLLPLVCLAACDGESITADANAADNGGPIWPGTSTLEDEMVEDNNWEMLQLNGSASASDSSNLELAQPSGNLHRDGYEGASIVNYD